MITDTMSYAEIAKELEEDFKNVERYQIHLPYKKYMREALKRPDGIVVFKTQEWVSPRKNKMLLIPVSRSRKETLRGGLRIVVCCVFLYRGQLNMAAKSITVIPWLHVQIFTSHFFQRYNERYLHDPSLEMMDVVRTFIRKEFLDTFSKLVKHPRLGTESFSAFPHGCSFSEICEDTPYILHHTFVVDDMLHTDQLLFLAELRYEQILDEYSFNKSSIKYANLENRVKKFHIKVVNFLKVKEIFQESGRRRDELKNLCFELSIDILDLVEVIECEPLHKLGKRLLYLPSTDEEEECEAELKKLCKS